MIVIKLFWVWVKLGVETIVRTKMAMAHYR